MRAPIVVPWYATSRAMTLCFWPLPGDPAVVARELQRRLDRLGAARGEEDAVEVAGRQARDPSRQLDRARMRVAPVGDEVELADLALHRLADLGAAVAGVAAEEAREAVEVAVAVLVVDVGALAAGDDRDRVLGVVAAHAREVHPQVLAGELLEVGAGLGGARGSRSSWPFSPPPWAIGGLTDVPYNGICPKHRRATPFWFKSSIACLYDSANACWTF